MKIVFHKKLMAALMIFLDQFKDHQKSFSERFFSSLEEKRPIAVRNDVGNYTLLFNGWQQHKKGQSLKIYVGDHPHFEKETVPYHTTTEEKVELKGLSLNKRSYFLVEDNKGNTIKISERLIPFKGTINFRDLGGFPTQNGQHTKWGKLYRSDHLTKLRKTDFPYFDSLNIKTICDFRAQEVAKRFPDSLPPKNDITIHKLEIVSEGLEMREMRSRILNNRLQDFDGIKIFNNAYKDFVHRAIPQFKIALSAAIRGNTPVLYHCTAGKDRTGFISSLLLALLGVSQDLIMKDFLASNYFRAAETKKYMERGVIFADMQPLVPLFEVQPIFLKTAFEEIEQQYRTVENYVIQAMGFSQEEIKQFRKNYLE